MAVFNSLGMELPSVVVTNENGAFTIQLANQHPGTTYYVRLRAADPSGTHATGGYALAANLAQVGVTAFGGLSTSTLTAHQSKLYTQMTVGGGKLTQFSLASSSTGSANSAVRMTIINAAGQTVFTLVSEAGKALTTGTVWLSVGTYTVVFNAATRDGSMLQGLTFNLSARERSDPVDPYIERPIGSPPPPPSGPITVIAISTLIGWPPIGPINDPIANPFAGF